MWWEYAIILAGVVLAAGYVLWTFVRSFRAKGNCCSSSCACSGTPPTTPDNSRLRVTPLVELKHHRSHEKQSD